VRDDAGEKLMRVPGVETALRCGSCGWTNRKPGGARVMVFVIGLDTRAFRRVERDVPMRENAALRRNGHGSRARWWCRRTCALHRSRWATRHLPGRLAGCEGADRRGWRRDYTWKPRHDIMDLTWFRQEYRDQRDVTTCPGAGGPTTEEVRKELMERHGDEYALSREEAGGDREVSSTLNKIYAIAYAQQDAVGGGALLGVVSACSSRC